MVLRKRPCYEPSDRSAPTRGSDQLAGFPPALSCLHSVWADRRALVVSSDPAWNDAICLELSSSSFWSLAIRSSMSLIFSSCCWSINEPLSFGVQKAHARKATRAKAIIPTKIDAFFPKGNTCHQVFLSFIAAVWSKQDAKSPTNDNIAIFKGRQDFPL